MHKGIRITMTQLEVVVEPNGSTSGTGRPEGTSDRSPLTLSPHEAAGRTALVGTLIAMAQVAAVVPWRQLLARWGA